VATPKRGLTNIRTLSGRVDQTALPYRAYMQITCLEMEKARRKTERDSASKRMKEIDARLEEIAAQQRELLNAVNNPAKNSNRRVGGMEVKASPPRSTGGFRIRY
jgi:phosphopantetheine adenylyltransferase